MPQPRVRIQSRTPTGRHSLGLGEGWARAMVPTGPGESPGPFHLVRKAVDNQFNWRNRGIQTGPHSAAPGDRRPRGRSSSPSRFPVGQMQLIILVLERAGPHRGRLACPCPYLRAAALGGIIQKGVLWPRGIGGPPWCSGGLRGLQRGGGKVPPDLARCSRVRASRFVFARDQGRSSPGSAASPPCDSCSG